MADVRRILRMRDDKLAAQLLLQKGSVGDDLWSRLLRAEKELEAEVLDVVNEANTFSSAWGPTIFATAGEMCIREKTAVEWNLLPQGPLPTRASSCSTGARSVAKRLTSSASPLSLAAVMNRPPGSPAPPAQVGTPVKPKPVGAPATPSPPTPGNAATPSPAPSTPAPATSAPASDGTASPPSGAPSSGTPSKVRCLPSLAALLTHPGTDWTRPLSVLQSAKKKGKKK